MNIDEGYPFIFQMNDRSETRKHLEYTLQYRFKSGKSNHTYIVRTERYINHCYCIKFFDKAHIHSDNKYSLRNSTFEPRRILYTVMYIMLDVLKKDPKASFFFIGANDEKDEPGIATRRFRIYTRFVSSVISTKLFEHFRVNEISLYILVNKSAVKELSSFAEKLTAAVTEELTNH